MKPDWKDAPEWANYLAMDKDGQWKWHQRTPVMFKDAWVCGGMTRHASYQDVIDWEQSEESRP